MIKILIILFPIFALLESAGAATCTLTTRSNYSSGQTLTSTALNADFNQLVTKVNSLDGGCVTDNTIEASALNTTDFAAVTNGIHQGCTLSVSDSNTISVGKCILSVNGNFVKTAIATTVTWGCTSCSSELNSTTYYVYAKTGSIGSTLNLLISSTAPGVDGYDGSGNKVLGKFYNSSAGAIQSVSSWQSSGFKAPTSEVDSFAFEYSNSGSECTSAGNCPTLTQTGSYVVSMARGGSAGDYTITFSRTYTYVVCHIFAFTAAGFGYGFDSSVNSNTMNIQTASVASPSQRDSYGSVSCWGY